MKLVARGKTSAGGTSLEVDLEASAGVTVISGPSASGKTLLLRAIAGLHPFVGTLTFDGRDLCALPPEARGVGYAPQEPAIWPHLSVVDHVRAFTDGPRADALLEAFALTGLLGRRTEVLSGGERQRLSLCRALAKRPKLLLLDEPTSALDPETRARVTDLVRRDADGSTILFVTHDPSEARRIGDAFFVVENGRLVSRPRPEG